MNRRNLFKLAAAALFAPLAKFLPKSEPTVEYMEPIMAIKGGAPPSQIDIDWVNWYYPKTDMSKDEIEEAMREELKTTVFEPPLKEATNNGIS
jgi:hypothetical protein